MPRRRRLLAAANRVADVHLGSSNRSQNSQENPSSPLVLRESLVRLPMSQYESKRVER